MTVLSRSNRERRLRNLGVMVILVFMFAWFTYDGWFNPAYQPGGESEKHRLFNQIMTFIGGALVLVTVVFNVMLARFRARFDASGVNWGSKPLIPWSTCEGLDRSELDTKAWVWLLYRPTSGGGAARLKIDSYHVHNFDEIMDLLNSRFLSDDLFKACDVRGVVKHDLSPSVYRRLGIGLGEELLALARNESIPARVVVGGDLRKSTPSYKEALIDGLRRAGQDIEVLDAGLVPTPAVYFAQRRGEFPAAAIVTASHNPKEYNGLKWKIGPTAPVPEDVERLKQRCGELDEVDEPHTGPRGKLTPLDVLDDYRNWLTETLEKTVPPAADGNKMKIVVDPGHGSFAGLAAQILKSSDVLDVIPIYDEPDGTFPDRTPNVSGPNDLEDLADEVIQSEADLGVAFDGDGDRVAFVDEKGQPLDSDEAALLFIRDFSADVAGKKIVFDLKMSQLLSEEVSTLDGAPLLERSGHAFIRNRVREEDAIFAAEVSGHYFWPELAGGDDGLYTAIKLIGLLARIATDDGTFSLSRLREELPARHITADIRLECPPEGIEASLQAIREGFSDCEILELDGIRVRFEDGWGLARPSITESKITFRFEGDSPDAVSRIRTAFAECLAPLHPPLSDALMGKTQD